MSHITFVTGGSRSGKSRYALDCALRCSPRAFIATAIAFDEEMKERIAAHQAERGDAFQVVEEPINLADAVTGLGSATSIALIDCLTVWLGNLMHEHGDDRGDYPELQAFRAMLDNPPMDLVIVSNEVGMGIIPENAMSRRYRDLAGNLNQQVACKADKVVFVVSGIPMVIKPSGGEA
jgi:adenosylcobinamide kinase/adenosylcobinamide-phosphate guanylyltransferase